MNAHSFRSLLSRRNAVPFTVFFFLAIVVVCGFIGSMGQLSAEASGDNGRSNQIPPEFNNPNPEKEFDDDDLKVKEQKKPGGVWDISIGVDKEQFYDSSVPVVVGTVQILSGKGKYAGVVKVKRLEITNRSSRAINSVQFRWKIFHFDDPSKVLQEGTTPFVNFWAEANTSRVVEIPTIYPVYFFNPLAKGGVLNGEFKLTIGVQETRFADGSFWRRQEPAVLLNFLYYDWFAAERFPSLASISPISPSSWGDPGGGTRGTFKPCEAKPGSSTSAFSFTPFQESTCQDNTNSKVDLITGAQSCGSPSPGTACYSVCYGIYCTVYSREGRCSSPTATPPISPSPEQSPCTPSEQPPAPCCTPESVTVPLTSIQDCRWDCRPNRCSTGTVFFNGCYSVSNEGPIVCEGNFQHRNDPSYGALCCPPTPTPTPPPGGCDGAPGSQTGDDGGSGGVGCNSPVVVDVLGDGFRLTGAAGGVWFDLNADGAPERLAWTAASSDDAWLALDRDGNGTIDSGQELFGNFTPQPTPPPGEERQGFLALAVFDQPTYGGNLDGVIDRRDSVFDLLRLWQDVNHNGVSEPAELHRLRALGLRTLELDYRESRRVDRHGNRFRYRARVRDARGAQLGRWAWDVFLVQSP